MTHTVFFTLIFLGDVGSSKKEEQLVTLSPEHHQRQKPGIADSDSSADSRQSSERDDTSKEFLPSEPEVFLPKVNCQEKIIICLDLSQELLSMSFQSKTSEPRSMLSLSKMAIDMFVKIKSKIDSRHEYALIALRNTAEWVSGFTCQPLSICNALSSLQNSPTNDDIDLTSVFTLINDHVQLPEVHDITLPPKYTVRVILLYGRSNCVPVIKATEGKEVLSRMTDSPYFFLDVLYIHETPSESNHCESILDQLYHLDLRLANYCLEASQHTVKIFNHMGALLAHPLQRPKQDERKPWRVR